MIINAIESATSKSVLSPCYNYCFSKATGRFVRWGHALADNPRMSPCGPEIADIEISVNGCPNGNPNNPNSCQFCYKSNTNQPAINMSLMTLQQILAKFPRVDGIMPLTQIAFGITGTQTNPEFLDMLAYCRELGIIPNFTLSGIDATDEFIQQAAKYVGAVAASAYPSDKQVCYNTVAKFLAAGVKQTNIHLLYHADNLPFVYEVLTDIQHDPRLAQLNAVVLLALKPMGRGSQYQPLPQADFDRLVQYAFDQQIPLGFDSCSTPKFLRWLESSNLLAARKKEIETSVEPCESTLFSIYINVHGMAYPCSFAESMIPGVSVLEADSIMEIWYSKLFTDFRKRLLNSGKCFDRRECILYPAINEE